MGVRWNPPPGWPTPPPGWSPPQGWRAPAEWPVPPPGWEFFVAESPVPPPPPIAPPPPPPAAASRRAHHGIRAGLVVLLVAMLAAGVLVGGSTDGGRLRAGLAQLLPGSPSAGAVAGAPATDVPGASPTPLASAEVPSAAPVAPASPAPAISVQPLPTPTVAELPPVFDSGPIRPPGFPPAGIGEEPRRIMAQVPSSGSTNWSAMTTNPDGTPAGFSPCRPWHVVVNLAGAPPGALETVAGAVATITRTTGIPFVLDGTTDEPVSAEVTRAAYQPERYGERWAPILIGWAPAAQEDAAGQGGPQGVTEGVTGMTHYVTGFVSIDTDGYANGDPVTLRAILLHELAHVVGLNHVDDPTQLMAPVYRGQREFQEGDLAGLAAVGAGSCSPDL